MKFDFQPSVQRRAAFTLIELLSVLIIIGLIAAIGIPAIKGLTKSQNDITAQRQLLDDIARARQLAITTRSDVYMVFVPPQIFFPTAANPDWVDPTKLGAIGGQLYTNLSGEQYRGYALMSQRRIGDQPGQRTTRYLTEWHTLPEGIYFATNKFWQIGPFVGDEIRGRFPTNTFPFPLATNQARNLPMIVFTGTGGLNTNHDAIIPLVRGSIFYTRDTGNGHIIPGPPDVLENLQSNSVAVYTRIRIEWLTGRAHVEKPEIQ